MPSLSSTPASSTLPEVGASTCAAGSQVWNGAIGVLIAKPTKNARNASDAPSPVPASGRSCARRIMSKVPGSEARNSPMIPSSTGSDPISV